MKLYSQLSKISFLKNRYVAKYLFVSFLGILIPIIGLLFFVVFMKNYLAPLDLFLITIFITLIGTVIMVVILKSLMLPILKASNALTDYGTSLTLPQLPTEYTDEAGLILKNIQTLILTNQKLLAEKKELCTVLTTDLKNETLNTELILNRIYKESTSTEVKKLATNAVESVNKQINFVDTYVELLVQEELISNQPIKVRKVNMQEIFDDLQTKRKVDLESKKMGLIFSIIISRMRLKVSNSLLQQALGYLLDNAIKNSPENSKIECNTEKHRGKLIIIIKDNGKGFDARQSEKIFSKFQSMNTESSDYTPVIGVYLAKQIIERFGGTIKAESDGPTKGVTFIIELKLYR